MKKTFVSLSLIMIVGLTSASAFDEPIRKNKVKDSFKKEFAGAEMVKWTSEDDYQLATFVLDGHRVIAYFDAAAELAGYGRGMLFTELPLPVKKSLEKHFTKADFVEVLEVNNAEGISYWLTVLNEKTRYRVKVGIDGDVLELNKVKK